MTGTLDLSKIESKINLKFDINLSKIESIVTGMQTINLKLNLIWERVRPPAQGPASAGEGRLVFFLNRDKDCAPPNESVESKRPSGEFFFILRG